MATAPKMNNRLQEIESFFNTYIAPRAARLDRDPAALKSALTQMGDRSWLALKADPELGGMGMSEAEYRRLQIAMARASGALTFLQTQHQSAVAKLARSENELLRQEFFPDVATGDRLVGVGFSHLRRSGRPSVQAQETADGYCLSGTVPWITGYDIFSHFILGAVLADGRELYGLLPLQDRLQPLGGQIAIDPPMELLAVTATNTVSAKLNRWHLKPDRVVTINPPGAIHISSRQNTLNHGFFALGCAYAGLDILQTIAEKKQLEFLNESWQALFEEVERSEREAIALIDHEGTTYQQRLDSRTKAIDLALRCSQAAVIASSGAANYFESSAGRVYREALLFSVSGQTNDVMEASLRNLCKFKAYSRSN